MSGNSAIEHRGVVSDIDGAVVRVKIEAKEACDSCHAKGVCTSINKNERIIEVSSKSSNNFSINDNVLITLKKSYGFKALILGYLIPLVIVVFGLVILIELKLTEALAGLLSIILLIPYFLILYTFKNKLKKKFNFELSKINL